MSNLTLLYSIWYYNSDNLFQVKLYYQVSKCSIKKNIKKRLKYFSNLLEFFF